MVCSAGNGLNSNCTTGSIRPHMTGKELQQRRKQLRLTQVQLADRIGVTSTCLARWERGERRISEPAARLLVLLCQLHIDKRRTR